MREIANSLKSFSYDFVSKNYNNNNSKSAKCKGTIYFLANSNNGEIYDWFLNFEDIELDLYTTSSWFNKKNSNFKKRSEFFSYVFGDEIIQKPRPNRKDNMLRKLTNLEKTRANDWFKNQYHGSFKNFIMLLSGNNPTGSFSKPECSQIKVCININNYKDMSDNFVMFFDSIHNICVWNERHDDWRNKIDRNKTNTDGLEYLQYLEDKKNIVNYFKLLSKNEIDNRNDKLEKKETFLKLIKNNLYSLSFIKDYLIKQGAAYRSSMPKNVSVFHLEKTKTVQRAHIKNVKNIIDEQLKEIKKYFFEKIHYVDTKNFCESKEYKLCLTKIKSEIIDINNLLDLSPAAHKVFDENLFTYFPNGKIHFINKSKIKRDDLEEIKKYYSQIPNEKMTQSRIEYIKSRNNKINIDSNL